MDFNKDSDLHQLCNDLDALSKDITAKQTQIFSLESSIKACETRLAQLNSTDLVVYQEQKKGVQFAPVITAVSTLSGSVLGFLKGLFSQHSGSSFLGMPPHISAAISLSLLGGGAAFLANYLRPLLSPSIFEYNDLPFCQVETITDSGHFIETQVSPDEGEYKAYFIANLLVYNEPRVRILLRQRDLPANIQQVQRLTNTLKSHYQTLAQYQQSLEQMTGQREAMSQTIVRSRKQGKATDSPPSSSNTYAPVHSGFARSQDVTSGGSASMSKSDEQTLSQDIFTTKREV